MGKAFLHCYYVIHFALRTRFPLLGNKKISLRCDALRTTGHATNAEKVTHGMRSIRHLLNA